MWQRISAGLVLGAFYLAVTCGLAARAQAPQVAVQPGQVDLLNSRVFVKVGARRFGHEHAVEGRIRSGFIALGAPTQAGELVFDLTSFQADTNAARNYLALPGDSSADDQKKVTANMHSDAVLDVAKHGTATFRLRSASENPNRRQNDPQMYVLEGDLTLHGKAQPVRISITAEPVKDQIRVRGAFNLKQTDYGITPFVMMLGAVGVTDEVRVFGDIFIKAADK